jgi:hypothetical protein
MMVEIQVMAGVSHKNVARLNWLIGSIPLPIDSRIPNGNTDINKDQVHGKIGIVSVYSIHM